MADELRDIIESVRSRVQAELEGQLRSLTERHEQALAEARRAAEAEGRRAGAVEAEQALAVKLQIARDEAQRRVQEAIAAVRAELERERVEETNRFKAELERERAEEANRLKAEADRRASEAAARVRAEMEQALAAEREQARARADADQRRAGEELQKARASFDAMRAADRAAHEAARLALEAELATRGASVSNPTAEGLIAAIREIDAADSISSTLAAIARAAARQTARAAVFVASGEQLREWEVPGTASLTPAPLYVRDTSIGVLGEAVRRREVVRSENGGVPSFAAHGARSVVAAPLLLEGQVVGVLYGDDTSPGDWAAALDVIASHGSARLGYLTALRTAQARRWIEDGGRATPDGAPSSDEEEQAARRYARLLVSEIKLYNEGAVHAGRENRDLMRRLASEIERARRMFDQRVPETVSGRAQMFHTELVQTLAGGDASLLG